MRSNNGVLLKKSKNFSPSAVRHCPSSSALRPPLLLTLPLSDIRRPTWGQSYFALKCKHLYRIGPTHFIALAPGRTSDRGNVRRSGGRSAECGVRSAECGVRTADGEKFLLLFCNTLFRVDLVPEKERERLWVWGSNLMAEKLLKLVSKLKDQIFCCPLTFVRSCRIQ